MKRVAFAIMILMRCGSVFMVGAQAKNEFPSKPIHVIVYTAPGGLIDITARKMVQIAAKYTNATMVVENKAERAALSPGNTCSLSRRMDILFRGNAVEHRQPHQH